MTGQSTITDGLNIGSSSTIADRAGDGVSVTPGPLLGVQRPRATGVARARQQTKAILRWARATARFSRDYWGQFPRSCPLCGYEGRFRAFGRPPRPDAECPSCHSKERHRHLALVLAEHPVLTDREVLHFAPEPAITDLVRRAMPERYVTADISQPTDLRLDLEAMKLDSESFDVAIVSHVMEHVDDRRALSAPPIASCAREARSC